VACLLYYLSLIFFPHATFYSSLFSPVPSHLPIVLLYFCFCSFPSLPVFFIHADEFFYHPLRHNREDEQTKSFLS
jgi:hypothetical protein